MRKCLKSNYSHNKQFHFHFNNSCDFSFHKKNITQQCTFHHRVSISSNFCSNTVIESALVRDRDWNPSPMFISCVNMYLHEVKPVLLRYWQDVAV